VGQGNIRPWPEVPPAPGVGAAPPTPPPNITSSNPAGPALSVSYRGVRCRFASHSTRQRARSSRVRQMTLTSGVKKKKSARPCCTRFRGCMGSQFMSRSRRFVSTLNNPQCTLEELWHQDMSYLVAGDEVAPQTGTRHFQIYFETKSKASMSTLLPKLASLWKSHPYLACAKGTSAQNKEYCTKGGTFWEHGEPMKQGARSDLQAVIASIADGSTMKQLWTEHPEQMIKFGQGIKRCYDMTSPNLTQKAMKSFDLKDFNPNWPLAFIQSCLTTKSIILWGKAGCGKTCFARAILPKALFVSHMDDLLKYDEGEHDGIIFDDMNFLHVPREAQIHIVDCEQPRSIHCRYQVANIPAMTKKIFTTNNVDGCIFLSNDGAIERRIERIELREELPAELNFNIEFD